MLSCDEKACTNGKNDFLFFFHLQYLPFFMVDISWSNKFKNFIESQDEVMSSLLFDCLIILVLISITYDLNGCFPFFVSCRLEVFISNLAFISQVVRYQSVEQLLLFGRLLQGSMELPWKFSHHPAATGSFFTLMFLGLKFCSCKSQVNLHNFQIGLQLLEDRIYR